MGEKQIQQLPAPDYDVDDEIRNWDELPFEGDKDEEEDPDYSLLEEDHKKDEILPIEKQTPRQPRQPRSRLPPRTPRPLSPRPQPRTPKPSLLSQTPKRSSSLPPSPSPSPSPSTTDTDDLKILQTFLSKSKHNPNAKISTPTSKFLNWDRNMAKSEVENIYDKRRKKVVDDFEKKNSGAISWSFPRTKKKMGWIGRKKG